MSSVARGTTPTFLLTFSEEDLDLTQADNVYVTFRSGARSLTKTGEDLEVLPKQISVYLSQEDTLSLSSAVRIQANWTFGGGHRAASEIVSYELSDQLLGKVIE